MSEREYRLDVCPECKVREGDSSEKKLYECQYCERWFCKRHLKPRLFHIPDLTIPVKDKEWGSIIEEEGKKKGGHPDYAYTQERYEMFKLEREDTWAKMGAFLDRTKAYKKPIHIPTKDEIEEAKAEKERELYFVKEESQYSPTLTSVQPKTRSHKVRNVILVVSLWTVLLIGLALLSGLIKFNIGTPTSVKETTISRVITEGMISVFEDKECRRPVQSIDWGKVESNRQYSRTVYVRNDNQEEWLDSGKRDVVWQRENVNPSSVYISIKVNYGDTKIKPNEVRQATITLTVLGLLEDSDKLNLNADIPQFTFDLVLKGQDLSLLTYAYIRVYALREANNITVVYKDELKETVSVITEIGIWKTKAGEQVMEVVWNSTQYVPEFTETWLKADIYTSYQLVVTINHERYGVTTYRNYLAGQLP